MRSFKSELLNSTFIVLSILFIMLFKVVLSFKPVDKTLVSDHSNESYREVLLCGTVYVVQGCSILKNLSLWMQP